MFVVVRFSVLFVLWCVYGFLDVSGFCSLYFGSLSIASRVMVIYRCSNVIFTGSCSLFAGSRSLHVRPRSLNSCSPLHTNLGQVPCSIRWTESYIGTLFKHLPLSCLFSKDVWEWIISSWVSCRRSNGIWRSHAFLNVWLAPHNRWRGRPRTSVSRPGGARLLYSPLTLLGSQMKRTKKCENDSGGREEWVCMDGWWRRWRKWGHAVI